MTRPARRAARKIVEDIGGRSGIKHGWQEIDADVMREIIEAWEAIIDREMGGRSGAASK